jgi:hypothetical protein
MALINRSTMLQSAFAVGLPNFSRTTEIERDSLGCAILAPEATYEGVLITAFEVASFSAQWRSPHALGQAMSFSRVSASACAAMRRNAVPELCADMRPLGRAWAFYAKPLFAFQN